MKLFFRNALVIKLILITSSLCILNSCGEPKTETVHEAPQTPPVDTIAPEKADTIDFVVIPFDTSHAGISGFSKSLQAGELSDAELHLIDSLAKDYLFARNDKHTTEKGSTLKTGILKHAIDLKPYKKQYLAVINAKGEKEVWANYFCKAIEERIEFVDWKKIPVKVIDGGDCFFNMRLNLTRRKAYDLHVNSEG